MTVFAGRFVKYTTVMPTEITVFVVMADTVSVVDAAVPDAVAPAVLELAAVQKATKFLEVEVIAAALAVATVVKVNWALVPALAAKFVVLAAGSEENMNCSCGNGGLTRKLQEYVVAVAVHVPGPGAPPPVPKIEYVAAFIAQYWPPHEQAQLAVAVSGHCPHSA